MCEEGKIEALMTVEVLNMVSTNHRSMAKHENAGTADKIAKSE